MGNMNGFHGGKLYADEAFITALTVSGTITYAGDISFDDATFDDVTIDDLTVTNAATVGTTLGVTGATDLAGALTLGSTVTFDATLNGVVNTTSDDKTVRLNSRSYAQASGSSIGFQAKPAQSVTSTGSVIGGEISPRVNDDIDIANVTGLHVDAYLKGTTAKTISGSIRGLELELVTDDAGTNTVSGDVSALRVRAAFSASTLTGVMAPIRVEKAEVQTNSQNWDCLFELTDTSPGVWNDDPGTELNTGTAKGYIKVLVNGAARYIALFEAGSLAD